MKNNTINKKEIEKFSKIAEEWWDPNGKFKPLHKFNPIRISYIKENIINTFNLKNRKDNPLSEIKIQIHSDNDDRNEIKAICRLDSIVEVEYFYNGGILQTVLRQMVKTN